MSQPETLCVRLFDLTAAAAEADARLTRLAPAARDALANLAQQRASGRGLMRGPAPIPLVLSPVSLPRHELAALGRAARLLVSALVKVSRDLIDRRPERANLLFHHLSPLELTALRTRSREGEELLVARVDWFVDRQNEAKALEVNSTIPAMQVYSDAAAAGWLDAVLASDPAKAEALAARNPSNAKWLLDRLLGAARAAGRGDPSKPFPEGLEVQILHREGDPQLTELQGLVQRLGARGVHAKTVTPKTIVLDGAPHRVLYRHLFARYVEPGTELGAALLDPHKHGMWNRVNGWLETKGLLAELSAHVDSCAGAGRSPLLTQEELACVREVLPWTRLLDDATAERLGDGDQIVLKRSHDYGGKSVVIGREAGPAAFAKSVELARKEPPGTWVAQQLVDAPASERWFCGHWPDGSRSAQRTALHLDLSTYASLLPGSEDGGSVVRAAPGLVVNIVGGGGVAPLFADDVLEAALAD